MAMPNNAKDKQPFRSAFSSYGYQAPPNSGHQQKGSLLPDLIRTGDLMRLKARLSLGEDPNAPVWDGEGWKTPLSLAVECLRPDMCRALIRAGADVRALNERGQTFLHQVFLPDDPLTGANAEQQMRDTNEGHSNGPSLPMSFPETSAGGETFNDRGETEPEISSVRAARGEQQGEAEAREEDKGTPPSFIFSFSQLELQELVGRLLLSEGVDHRSRDESGRTAADYAETSGNPLGKFLRALDGVKQREAVQQKLCSNRGAGASAGPPRPPTGSASTLGGLGASDALEGGKGSAEAAAGGGGVPPPPAGGLSRQGSWGVSSVASPFLLFSSPYSSGAGGGRQTGIGIGGPRMTPPPFSSGSMSPLCMGECLLGGKECGSGRGRSGSLSHQSTVPPCSSCLGPAAAGASSSVSASFGEVTTTCRQGIGSVRSGVAVAVGPSGRLLTGQSGGLGAAGSDDGASPTFFPFHVPPPCTPLPPRPSGGQWGLSQRGCCHGGLSGVHGSLHTGGSGSGSPLASPPYHLTPPAAGTRPPPSTPLVWGGPRVPGRECDGGNAGALSGRNSSNGGLHGTPVPPPLTRLPLPPLQLPSPLLAHPLSASRNSRNRPHAVNSRERASSSSSGNPFQLASSCPSSAELFRSRDRDLIQDLPPHQVERTPIGRSTAVPAFPLSFPFPLPPTVQHQRQQKPTKGQTGGVKGKDKTNDSADFPSGSLSGHINTVGGGMGSRPHSGSGGGAVWRPGHQPTAWAGAGVDDTNSSMDTPTPTVGLQPRRRILSNFPIRPPPAFPPLLSSGEWDSPVSRVGPVRGGARVPPCFTWSPLESPHPLPSAEQQQPQQRAEGREDLGRHTQSVFTDKGGLRANAPAERESEGPTRTSTRASSSSACPIVPSTSNVLECSHEGGNGHVRGGGEAAEVATERHEEVEEEEESPKSGRDPEVSSHPRHWQSRERGSAVPRNYQNREEVGVKESCPLSGGKMGGEGQKEERKRSSSRIVKGSLASLLWGLRHLPEEVLPVVLDFVALDGECREYAEAKKWWCQKASSSVPRVGALPSISHQLQQQSEHTTTGSSGRRSALNRPTTQHPAVGSLTHTRTTRGGTPTSRVPRPPSTQAVCPDGCREQGGTRGQSRRPLHLEPLSLSVALADSGRGSREPPKAQNQKGGSSRLPVQGDVSNSTPEGQEGCFAFPRVPAPSSSVCPPPFPPDGHYAGSPVSFRRRRPNVPPPVDTRFAQLSGVLLHSREGGRGFGLSWFPAEGADSPTTVEQQHPSHTAATGSASSSFACWPPESSTHQQVLTASLSARVDEPLSGDASPLFWEGPEGGRGDGCEWTGEAASMSVHKDLCKRAERGECVPPYLHQQKGFCSAAGRGERVARRNRPSAPAVPNRSPPAEIHPSCLPSSFSSGRGHTGGEGGYSRGGGEGQRERGTVVDMSPCTLLLRKKVNSLRFAGLEWPPM